MLFLTNPGKRRTTARRKKSGRKRRSAAQKAATRKMLAAAKRARAGTPKRTRTTRKVSMTRRRKRAGAPRRRRRTSRRAASRHVVRSNPRRRRRAVTHRTRRRGRVHRNPGIVGIVRQGAMDAVATLGGGAAARIVSGFVPLPDTGITGVAKGLAVAVGISIAARRFLGGDRARFVTAGAMQVPIKNLITTFLPQAGAYLGDYSMYGRSLNAYDDGAVSSYLDNPDSNLAGSMMEDDQYIEAYQ